MPPRRKPAAASGASLVVIKFIFSMQVNIKFYHWMTKSYARHMAADRLFEQLISLGDKFIEVYLGKYSKLRVYTKSNSKLEILNLTDATAPAYLDKCIRFIKHEIPKHIAPTDTDLASILDELEAELNNTKYLFAFKG